MIPLQIALLFLFHRNFQSPLPAWDPHLFFRRMSAKGHKFFREAIDKWFCNKKIIRIQLKTFNRFVFQDIFTPVHSIWTKFALYHFLYSHAPKRFHRAFSTNWLRFCLVSMVVILKLWILTLSFSSTMV